MARMLGGGMTEEILSSQTRKDSKSGQTEVFCRNLVRTRRHFISLFLRTLTNEMGFIILPTV